MGNVPGFNFGLELFATVLLKGLASAEQDENVAKRASLLRVRAASLFFSSRALSHFSLTPETNMTTTSQIPARKFFQV